MPSSKSSSPMPGSSSPSLGSKIALFAVLAALIIGGSVLALAEKQKQLALDATDTSASAPTISPSTVYPVAQPVPMGVPTTPPPPMPPALIHPSAIEFTSLKGGESFHPGDTVHLAWKNNAYYPAVSIQVVQNTIDRCTEYTHNGSMGTCFGKEIYSGPNKGSFDWIVPDSYPSAGTYLFRIWPDVGMEGAHELIASGYNLDGYSSFFTILGKSGELTVTNEADTPAAVAHGSKDVELASFDFSADAFEGIRIYGIAFEFYSQSWQEILPSSTLTNLRLVDDRGTVLLTGQMLLADKELPANGGYGYSTTYAWLTGPAALEGSFDIDPSASKHIRLIADTDPSSTLGALHTIIPSISTESPTMFGAGLSSHFKAFGRSSGLPVSVTGGASGDVYFTPANGGGAVTFSSDMSYHPEYSRYAHGAVITKLHVAASNEEDVDLSQVALRISNLIEGQYSNVRLVREGGGQYGQTIASPQVVETGSPNVVFSGSMTLHKGETAIFDLVADLSVDAATDIDSYNGQPYQHEVLIYATTNQTEGWVRAASLKSELPVPVSGGADTFLKFI